MTDERRSPPVTRAELYPILGSVYLLIAVSLLGLVGREGDSTLRLVGYLLMFGVALGLSLTFNVLGIKERRSRTTGSRDAVEPGAAADRGGGNGLRG